MSSKQKKIFYAFLMIAMFAAALVFCFILKNRNDEKKYQTAVQLYEQKRFKEAFALFQEIRSNPHAAAYMGVMLSKGKGVEKDARRALAEYERAIALGSAEASFNAGLLHLEGSGDDVPKNLKKAVACFERSKQLGCAEAAYNLAVIFGNEQSPFYDRQKSADMLKFAFERNLPAAQCLAAYQLLTGRNREQDIKRGLECLRMAAHQKDPVALFVLGRLYLLGIAVRRDAGKAYDCFRLAAESPCVMPEAECVQGIMDIAGLGTPRDMRVGASRFLRGLRRSVKKRCAISYDAL